MGKFLIIGLAIVVVAHIVIFAGAALSRRAADEDGPPSRDERVVQAVVAAPEPPLSFEPFTPENPPSAAALLDRYAQTQGRIYRAFHTAFEITERQKFSDMTGRTRHYAFEIGFDAPRFRMTRRRWGNCVNDPGTYVPESGHFVTRWLWDGSTHFSHADVVGKQNNPVNVRRDVHDMVSTGNTTDKADRWIRGYFGSYMMRFDRVLRESGSAELHDTMVTVGGVACHVVEAETRHGHYTAWIDPDHGYNLAQAAVTKGPGHLDYETQMAVGAARTYFLRSPRFQEVQGVWITMEAETGYRWDEPDGSWRESTAQYKRTSMILNPDFGEDYFVPDFPNGVPVRLEWLRDPGRDYFDVAHTWRDGQVVDGEGRAVPLL